MQRFDRFTTISKATCNSTEDDQQIIQIAEQETFATRHDMKEDLDMRGVEVTERTIRRRLNEAGAKFSLPMKSHYLVNKID